MRRIKKILQSQTGIALITVILIISILVAAALELNRSSRADVYDAANLSDGLKLTYMAKSGFYGAVALLVNSTTPYDTLRDDWAQAEILSAQSKALFTNGYFIVRIEDETGKIPLYKLLTGDPVNPVNPVMKEILVRLLQQPEFALDERRVDEIVDAIIDWMDADERVSTWGAESSYYASLERPYAAKNAPLDCIEELLMIRGITNELFAGKKDKPGLGQFVTIYGTGVININTAPKMVLRALSPDITAEVADRMDEYRRNKNNNLSAANWYTKVPGIGSVTIKAEMTVKSDYFKIFSTGVADRMEQSVVGVIQRAPFRIMNWRQD
ncbi:MAG TPA: type II secretion system minor pseudopilin GspK [Smithellaceae bacterium]|nr:type II secretion system minor pseudopilin GspK [Smithellaceae bacterium]